MIDNKVRLVKPGKTYFGAQGVAYGSGASRKTAGSERICMNILPMPPGVHPVPHVHKDIETIAYLLEGECTLFHGDKLENQTLVIRKEVKEALFATGTATKGTKIAYPRG